MECKEEGKVTLNDIPNLTNVPTYLLTITMSKHFVTSRRTCHSVTGLRYFPWITLSGCHSQVQAREILNPQGLDQVASGKELMWNFFKFEESD